MIVRSWKSLGALVGLLFFTLHVLFNTLYEAGYDSTFEGHSTSGNPRNVSFSVAPIGSHASLPSIQSNLTTAPFQDMYCSGLDPPRGCECEPEEHSPPLNFSLLSTMTLASIAETQTFAASYFHIRNAACPLSLVTVPYPIFSQGKFMTTESSRTLWFPTICKTLRKFRNYFHHGCRGGDYLRQKWTDIPSGDWHGRLTTLMGQKNVNIQVYGDSTLELIGGLHTCRYVERNQTFPPLINYHKFSKGKRHEGQVEAFLERFKEAENTTDMFLVNAGLHFNEPDFPEYENFLHKLLHGVAKHSRNRKRFTWIESQASHYNNPEASYTPGNPFCGPLANTSPRANWRNIAFYKIMNDRNLWDVIHIIPWYNRTAFMHEHHGFSGPSGSEVNDCVHFCYYPFMYEPIFYHLHQIIARTLK